MSHRGFSLIEMMVATAIVSFILAGAVGAGMQMQRRGMGAERAVEAQDANRALKDLISQHLLRAGSGINNFAVEGAPRRYALHVESAAVEADFPVAGFSPPPDGSPYRASDALFITWGDVERAAWVVPCSAVDDSLRTGDDLCLTKVRDDGTEEVQDLFAERGVIISNPSVIGGSAACANKVTNTASFDAQRTEITVASGFDGSLGTDPCTAVNAGFYGEPGMLAVPRAGVGFRVNWASGAPVLELDPDGEAIGADWQPIAQDVESFRVRFGVGELNSPVAVPLWFPDAAAGRPAVDECTVANCAALLPGGTDARDDLTTDQGVRDALMRRVHMVELEVTSRSSRVDVAAIRKDTGGDFVVDPIYGHPLDGFKRRTMSVRLSPRNLRSFH